VIHLEGVGRTYATGGGVTVLRDVNLRIESGEAVCIVGPSGSGKSTLLHLLGLLDRPSTGTFRFEGQDTSLLDDTALSQLRGRRIGFIFQQFHLIPHLTVLENVEVPLFYQRVPAPERHRRARRRLEEVGLTHREHHRSNQLSGGECQRVAIARALVSDAELLLADEPTGNLDQKTGAEILKLFDVLRGHGRTLVCITHDLHVADRFPRRLKIADGVLTEEAS
jgi:putative ABC transport system ATP-binding protein